MKNLVMGFSTNQTEHDMRVFCTSLRRIYSPEECDLVLITNRYEEYFADLARDGVQFISTTSSYPAASGKLAKVFKRVVLSTLRAAARFNLFDRRAPEIAGIYPILLEIWHHPHFVRWIAYERFLTLNRNYGQVFLSDVKDVLFQARLFNDDPGDQVNVFEQDEIYGTADCDTKWYRDAWGEAALEKVLGKKALCIGTILGPHREVLSMVRELRAFFELRPFGAVEQSVFNYLIHNDLMRTPYRIMGNISGPVGTLSNDIAHSATVARDGYIRRATDGSIIPAVHMYDRWPDTKEICSVGQFRYQATN